MQLVWLVKHVKRDCSACFGRLEFEWSNKMATAQLTYLEWPGPRVLLPPAGVTAPHRHPLPHDALTSQLKGTSNTQLHSLHLKRKVQKCMPPFLRSLFLTQRSLSLGDKQSFQGPDGKNIINWPGEQINDPSFVKVSVPHP